MAKIACLFPGQGSQSLNMCRDYIEGPMADDIISKANNLLGYDIRKIIYAEDRKLLDQTLYTQPSIYILNFIIYMEFKKLNLKPSYFMGHSLGEYSALVASEVIDFYDGLRLVQKRAKILSKTLDKIKGGMLAIVGFDINRLESLVKTLPTVEFANYNSSNQCVLSYIGEAPIQRLSKYAKKVVPLKVSGPFHSHFISKAGEIFKSELKKYNFSDPKVEIIFNYSAKPVKSINEMLVCIKKQMDNPVRWSDSLQFLKEKGVTTICELGPGKVLSNLAKDKGFEIFSLNTIRGLNKLKENFYGRET